MHNFYHEIPLPADKAIRKFLWVSYFHDSLIQEIFLDEPGKNALTLKVDCARDGYMYLLQFHGVAHFEYSSPRNGWHIGEEISSTVFKDTALLHRLQREGTKPLYHLRFSHRDGYTDVIFQRFTIRREGGRVNYKSEVPPEKMGWQICLNTPNGAYLPKFDPFVIDFSALSAKEEEERAELTDDILWARLFRLHQSRDTAELLLHARCILDEHLFHEHAPLYAAYLLGKYGDTQDIPALTKLYLGEENLLKKRTLLEAMELIQERTT